MHFESFQKHFLSKQNDEICCKQFLLTLTFEYFSQITAAWRIIEKDFEQWDLQRGIDFSVCIQIIKD